MNALPVRGLRPFADTLACRGPAQPVARICRWATQSRQAVAFRLPAGFQSVYNLADGTEARSLEIDRAFPRH